MKRSHLLGLKMKYQNQDLQLDLIKQEKDLEIMRYQVDQN